MQHTPLSFTGCSTQETCVGIALAIVMWKERCSTHWFVFVLTDLHRGATPIDLRRHAVPFHLQSTHAAPIDLQEDASPIDLCSDAALID